MSCQESEMSSYKGRRWPVWLKTLLALVLAGCLCFGGLLAAVLTGARDEVKGDPQLMVILGCQVKPWGPSILLQDRLDKALEYFEAHPDTVIVTSGAQGADEPRPEGEVMRDWLIACGAAPSDVLAETDSRSTRQNLQNAAALLPPGARVTVVTSDYHLPRALAIARDIGLDADGLPAPCRRGLSFWLKNHSRETLAWGKFLLEKIIR